MKSLGKLNTMQDQINKAAELFAQLRV
jgi:hypothetical protein